MSVTGWGLYAATLALAIGWTAYARYCAGWMPAALRYGPRREIERARDRWRLSHALTGIVLLAIAVVVWLPALLAGHALVCVQASVLVAVLIPRLVYARCVAADLHVRVVELRARAQAPVWEMIGCEEVCRCAGTRAPCRDRFCTPPGG